MPKDIPDHAELLLDRLRRAGRLAAEAKARFDYLDYYRRHLIANLMTDAQTRGAQTIAAQEREALASATYLQHLEALREAQIDSANAGHELREAELAIEIWRTQQATERLERRAYNA